MRKSYVKNIIWHWNQSMITLLGEVFLPFLTFTQNHKLVKLVANRSCGKKKKKIEC